MCWTGQALPLPPVTSDHLWAFRFLFLLDRLEVASQAVVVFAFSTILMVGSPTSMLRAYLWHAPIVGLWLNSCLYIPKLCYADCLEVHASCLCCGTLSAQETGCREVVT